MPAVLLMCLPGQDGISGKGCAESRPFGRIRAAGNPPAQEVTLSCRLSRQPRGCPWRVNINERENQRVHHRQNGQDWTHAVDPMQAMIH